MDTAVQVRLLRFVMRREIDCFQNILPIAKSRFRRLARRPAPPAKTGPITNCIGILPLPSFSP